MTSTRREVLVVAHTGRPEVATTLHGIAARFGAEQIALRVLDQEVHAFSPSGEHPVDVAAMRAAGAEVSVVPLGPSAARGCEMVVALGGDGTFLRAAEAAHPASVPVLGINMGHIGFLAEAEASALDGVVDQIIARDYRVEERMTLQVEARGDDGVVDRTWALNEVSIQNASRHGVLELVLEVDGRPVSAFGADGILVATPTGSTAYAFSAGGPVIWPQLEAMLVVPSNAHAIFSRPLVTSPESIVAVEVEGGRHAVAFCDGRRELAVPPGARVEVVRGDSPVRWVKIDSAPFADRVVRKFELPISGWRGRRS